VSILTQINLTCFIPVIVFTLVLWSDIRKKPQYGRRPRYLFLSLLIISFIGIFLFQYTLLDELWAAELSFTVFAVIFSLYILTFFILEYSIHCQRIIKSYVWDDFIKNLKTTFIFWIIIAVIILTSVLLFILYRINIFSGSIVSVFSKPAVLSGWQQKGWAGREDFKLLSLFLSLFFAIISFTLLCKYRKKVFLLQIGVVRTNSFTFNMSFIVLVLMLGYFIIFDGFGKPLPGEIFIFLTVAYIIRVYMEYFYQRILHLEGTIEKQGQSVVLMNELVSREASSTLEEDVDILKSTILQELERVKKSLPVAEYAFSGSLLYSLDGDILKVISAELINGFCIPLVKHSTLKLLRTKQQIEESILKKVYDLNKISSLALQDQTEWGEQIIKQLLETKERITISQIPDELKGLQRLIVINPIFDKERLLGMFIVFKDSSDKLFPEEENALNGLIENLRVILMIIAGKKIQQDRNRLSNEMNIAKNIQVSILPKTIDIPGYEAAANMVTATEVGGDVYNYICTKMGNYLGIGDVSGHGLAAGIMSLIQLVAFEAVVMVVQNFAKDVKPYELYDIVNKLLCKINKDRIGSDKFMTQNYLIENNGTFRYAGAHEIALLYRKKENNVVELKDLSCKAAFLGLMDTITAKGSEGSFTMKKNDLLLLYTDGAIQAKNSNGNQFGIAKLKRILGNNASLPLEKLIDKIMKEIYNHALNGDLKKYSGNFADDISLLVLRKK
jgi:sigma-B regulation protein RsbU (phosphoserine phosphatase)